MPKAPTYYISGPMTGLPNNNYPAFHHYADRLRAHGVAHINPVDIAVAKQNPEWHDYLAQDLQALIAHATHVAVMPGWEASRGATLEVFVAQALGRPIVCIDALLAGRHQAADTGDIIEAALLHFDHASPIQESA